MLSNFSALIVFSASINHFLSNPVTQIPPSKLEKRIRSEKEKLWHIFSHTRKISPVKQAESKKEAMIHSFFAGNTHKSA